MVWTHTQMTGWLGNWFIDRMWDPTMIETPIGFVVDGNKRMKRKDGEDIGLPRWYDHFYDRAWIADVAGICTATPSRMKSLGLTMQQIAPREYKQLTYLCEVKVTRADFTADDKWSRPPQAHVQFIASPHGLIGRNEVPNGWGLLEVRGDADHGRVFKYMVHLQINDILPDTELTFVNSILHAMWSRDKNTKIREEMRKYREYTSANKIMDIVSVIVSYLNDDSNPMLEFAEYMKFYGIRRSIPNYIEENIVTLKKTINATKAGDLSSCERALGIKEKP